MSTLVECLKVFFRDYMFAKYVDNHLLVLFVQLCVLDPREKYFSVLIVTLGHCIS